MIGKYKKRQTEEKEHQIRDYHIMDNYIEVLTFLHKTNRFEKFFDPMRLKMMLIKPSKMDDPHYLDKASSKFDKDFNVFYGGCDMYKNGHYARAAECFRRIVDSKNTSLYYESRFNLGACLFKMAEFKQALRQF